SSNDETGEEDDSDDTDDSNDDESGDDESDGDPKAVVPVECAGQLRNRYGALLYDCPACDKVRKQPKWSVSGHIARKHSDDNGGSDAKSDDESGDDESGDHESDGDSKALVPVECAGQLRNRLGALLYDCTACDKVRKQPKWSV